MAAPWPEAPPLPEDDFLRDRGIEGFIGALLKATLAVGKRPYASGVVDEVVQLRGVLKDAGRAADWLVRLSRHAPIRVKALTSAGYLYLKAGQSARAVKVLEQGVRARKSGLGLTYLGDAIIGNMS